LNFLDRFSQKSSNTNVHEKPSSGSQGFFVRMDKRTETQSEGQKHRRTDREGDMIQLTVAFGNSVKEPKNGQMGHKHAAYL
jgi:RNA binding exosome subunit